MSVESRDGGSRDADEGGDLSLAGGGTLLQLADVQAGRWAKVQWAGIGATNQYDGVVWRGIKMLGIIAEC